MYGEISKGTNLEINKKGTFQSSLCTTCLLDIVHSPIELHEYIMNAY